MLLNKLNKAYSLIQGKLGKVRVYSDIPVSLGLSELGAVSM